MAEHQHQPAAPISRLLSAHAGSLRALMSALTEQAALLERAAVATERWERVSAPLPDIEVPAGVAAQLLGISPAAFSKRVRRGVIPRGTGPRSRKLWRVSTIQALR